MQVERDKLTHLLNQLPTHQQLTALDKIVSLLLGCVLSSPYNSTS